MEAIKKYFGILQGLPDYLPSVISIVIANLIVLIGIAFFSWTISDMILLYWAESAIIGVFTVLKMALARGQASDAPGAPKLFMIPFFIFHYGMFMMVHLVFLLVLVLPVVGQAEADQLEGAMANVVAGLAALLVSHTVSFATNYLGKKEYEKASAELLIGSPYGRIIAMQFFIIGSAFIFGLLDFASSRSFVIAYATIVIAGKTLFDLIGHLGERESFQN